MHVLPLRFLCWSGSLEPESQASVVVRLQDALEGHRSHAHQIQQQLHNQLMENEQVTQQLHIQLMENDRVTQ